MLFPIYGWFCLDQNHVTSGQSHWCSTIYDVQLIGILNCLLLNSCGYQLMEGRTLVAMSHVILAASTENYWTIITFSNETFLSVWRARKWRTKRSHYQQQLTAKQWNYQKGWKYSNGSRNRYHSTIGIFSGFTITGSPWRHKDLGVAGFHGHVTVNFEHSDHDKLNVATVQSVQKSGHRQSFPVKQRNTCKREKRNSYTFVLPMFTLRNEISTFLITNSPELKHPFWTAQSCSLTPYNAIR